MVLIILEVSYSDVHKNVCKTINYLYTWIYLDKEKYEILAQVLKELYSPELFGCI